MNQSKEKLEKGIILIEVKIVPKCAKVGFWRKNLALTLFAVLHRVTIHKETFRMSMGLQFMVEVVGLGPENNEKYIEKHITRKTYLLKILESFLYILKLRST